jgi:tripartite-type tricarboxylate transporter receptor subunit TctC
MKLKKMAAGLAMCTMALAIAACGGGSKKQAAKSEGGAWKPKKEIKVIVAYKAGSGTDTGARVLVKEAEKVIGKTLVIENKPGADGKIGWTDLAKAKPDGYTIGYINLPTYTTLCLAKGASFSTDSIIPICNHLTETSVVVVKADSKWKTLKELVADAQKNPGKFKCSTNGVKASNHTAAQLLSTTAKFKYNAVPYGGTADQLLALRQGEVDFSCAKVGDVAKLIKGAKPELRILGLYSEKRDPALKDVPTLKELGYYGKWYGSARALVAPKGTPDNIIKFYVDAFKKCMSDPATIEAHKTAGLELDFKDNKALGDLIKEQLAFCKDTVTNLYK